MFVHPYAVRAQALKLVDAGENDCEIARRLRVPRTTVRDWRHHKGLAVSGMTCPRCWRYSHRPIVFSARDYSELLALYLGDGYNLSYEFSNRSAQIRELFMDACDLVGVEYRRYSRYVRIYRRMSVALMQQHVGMKA